MTISSLVAMLGVSIVRLWFSNTNFIALSSKRYQQYGGGGYGGGGYGGGGGGVSE